MKGPHTNRVKLLLIIQAETGVASKLFKRALLLVAAYVYLLLSVQTARATLRRARFHSLKLPNPGELRSSLFAPNLLVKYWKKRNIRRYRKGAPAS